MKFDLVGEAIGLVLLWIWLGDAAGWHGPVEPSMKVSLSFLACLVALFWNALVTIARDEKKS